MTNQCPYVLTKLLGLRSPLQTGATMLSEREERRFNGIARQLTESDPGLAARMRAQQARRVSFPERRMRRWHTLVIVLSVVSALVCLACSHAGAAPSAVPALALAGATFLIRRRRFPTQQSRHGV
jgi:MYXO-CTERM domain-containing protein